MKPAPTKTARSLPSPRSGPSLGAALLAASLLACGSGSTPPGPASGVPPSTASPATPAAGATPATQAGSAPAPDARLRFEERGVRAGLIHGSVSGDAKKSYILEANGPGLCVLDYDLDGDQDLFVVDGQTLDGSEKGRSTLYRNLGELRFEDATDGSGLGEDGWGFGCASADWDNDGWPDLFVAAWKSDHLYRNLGDGRFADVTAAAGLADQRWGESAAFGDYDRDGLLDLYVANYLRFDDETRLEPEDRPGFLGLSNTFKGPIGLIAEPDFLYRNRGDGSFEEVGRASGIANVKPAYGLAVLFADLDDDLWPDIYVANDSVPNFLFRNQRDGRFREIGVESGLAFNGDGKAQASMGIAFGDMDRDGDDDALVTNFSDDHNTLYRNDAGSFVDVSWESGIGAASWSRLAWGTLFLDADADGVLDLFVGNGHVFPQLRGAHTTTEYEQEDQLFRGDGAGNFRLVSAGELGASKHLTRGVAAADFDRDGRLDIATVRLHESPALYRNVSESGSWIEPLLAGQDCNRDALGAVVTIPAGAHRLRRRVLSGGSYASESQRRLHFGLGSADAGAPVSVEVTWPCGRKERFGAATGSFPLLVEGAGAALP